MKRFLPMLALCAYTVSAQAADLSVVVVTDPTSNTNALTIQSADFQNSFNRIVGQPARVERSSQLFEVMRATRTRDYDIIVGPSQVAASARAHGYELLGSTKGEEAFVLVTGPGLEDALALRGKKLYLPQQDSLHAYMAKGLLNEAGIPLKSLASVQYRNIPGAGLVSVLVGMADATIVRQSEFDDWRRIHSTAQVRVMLRSKPVPDGLTVAVRGDIAAPIRAKVGAWAASALNARLLSPTSSFDYVGGLGHFTPNQLPGATRVSAQEVAQLIKRGAVIVDVRSDKEYKNSHIPGAVNLSYIERSLKEIDFAADLDDFSAASRLDASKPTVFYCNGPECWKSYKACKAALKMGIKNVYWFRGGMPEWTQASPQAAAPTAAPLALQGHGAPDATLPLYSAASRTSLALAHLN